MMMTFRSSKDKDPPMNPNPLDQIRPPQPVPIPAALARQRSEIAAQAAQQAHEMEQALEDSHAQLMQASTRVHLLEAKLEEIKAQLLALADERDWHKARHIRIENSLRNSASILLDVLREPMPESVVVEHQTDPERIKQAVEGIERELAQATAGKEESKSSG
jgi:septal ring factor EnvC (AmiA/AmiB activator)